MTAIPNVKHYIARINQSDEKSVRGFIEQGKSCAEADEKLSPEQKKELHAQLRMHKTGFSACVAIGRCDFLEKYSSSLPPSRSTLHMLTQLEEKQFKAGIAEGIIYPNAPRQAVQAWINGIKGKASVANDNEGILRYRRPDGFTDEQQASLDRVLLEALGGFDCKPTGTGSQAVAATQKARGEYLRSNTRAVIAAEKLRRRKEQGRKPKAQRSNPWPFSPEQVKIASASTPEDFQRILDLIGCGDEWQKILDDAARLYGVVTEDKPTPSKTSRKKAA
jgi:hypothetical protein